jgi:hypothetical protein
LYNYIPEGLNPDKDYYSPHNYLAGSEYFKVEDLEIFKVTFV